MIKINFEYTDEFGQESILRKTYIEDVLEVMNSFDMLVEDFKNFLLATGFSEISVNKIKIDEDSE